MTFVFRASPPPPPVHLLRNPISVPPSPPIFRPPSNSPAPRVRALKTSSGEGQVIPGLLRKPASVSLVDDEDAIEEVSEQKEEAELVDWEDQILGETLPLVGLVRMILHSDQSGERLASDHEQTILERLLPYHPGYERKIGCGVDYITVGHHPDFESSRCLFIVRKDGELVDFSYWKCIKGLIKKTYPQYADGFILRHFR
ncbi:protein DCL homolog, chloroplastic-like isoform X2 [Malania oleifera]|uniref:protein DCL homolog, chloroplastic-like isoform X2 n=1 Tax=Malania oleifera TaxID=397392 RepID=UPI0025AE22EB|nr:protein DCL homolog, chloroplastic-like isoform X2 [Malania oleifera]